MALLTVRTVSATGSTPAPVQCANGDTISASDIGERGVILRVANTSGASITVVASDPGKTPAGNSPTLAPITVPATTGVRELLITKNNVDLVTQVATLTYTGSLSASTTHEAFRY